MIISIKIIITVTAIIGLLSYNSHIDTKIEESPYAISKLTTKLVQVTFAVTYLVTTIWIKY